MCSILLGDSVAKEMGSISLSNDSVKRRIDYMSENVRSQLISHLKTTKIYALQLDECTYLTDKSHLLAFVRYEYQKLCF